ncbi:XRE family transcriptional regulator [Robertmurraya yapensis]|uniref:XRE family transcriptional regulator n=3 Tax=Bacillaceae TaxID=186817 RepID=A0A3S0INL8_9BACI|nr:MULTISPECIES: helix-turn-helix transcriptional regulator [Bacillaceae]RTR28083.1 XRE family transcriptional regulator [Bacillus yapensis]TKC15198.1 helix-turn-helix domain-containing protein [Robertmurraya kyonggiensis]TKS94325.1 helix-turn-helix domain-containing protein [Bacillus yapensis]
MELEGILLNMFLPRTKGACIAHFRNMLCLTQSDISVEIGINRSSISKMENGDINVSENVWSHILRLVYDGFDLEKRVQFKQFRSTLEIFIDEENVTNGGVEEWKERKLS